MPFSFLTLHSIGFPPVSKVAGSRVSARNPDTGPKYYIVNDLFYQAVPLLLTSEWISNIIFCAMKGRVVRIPLHRELPVAVRKQSASDEVHPGAAS